MRQYRLQSRGEHDESSLTHEREGHRDLSIEVSIDSVTGTDQTFDATVSLVQSLHKHLSSIVMFGHCE